MDLEVGKKYKTRGGCVVTLIYKLDDPDAAYPFIGVSESTPYTYALNGRHQMGVEGQLDLVEEYAPRTKYYAYMRHSGGGSQFLSWHTLGNLSPPRIPQFDIELADE